MTVSTMFPDAYATIPLADLRAAYAAAPLRVRTVVQGLSSADVMAHPFPDKWSVQQIVCHLADAEVVGSIRFRQAIAQPGVTVPCYDQDAWADGLDYEGRGTEGLDRALGLFATLRSDVVAMFDTMPADAWANTVTHPEYGELTLRQVLEIYADHGERHIAQILDRRRLLNRPLELPLLLPNRLY